MTARASSRARSSRRNAWPSRASRPPNSCDQHQRFRDILGDAPGIETQGALLGERRFFARLGRELGKLLGGMGQIIFFGGRPRAAFLERSCRIGRAAPRLVGARDNRAREASAQRNASSRPRWPRGSRQAALVALAMKLDQCFADRSQKLLR